MKRNRFPVTFLILSLISSFAQALGLESKAQEIKIESYSLDDQNEALNLFSIDCAKLLSPGNTFFNRAELFETGEKDRYLLRIHGKLDDQSELAFTKARFVHKDLQEVEKFRVFDLRNLKIPMTQEREFTFATPIEKGQTRIPLTLSRSQSELFDLVININDQGVLTSAYLKGVIDPFIKKHLCFRRRWEFSTFMGATSYTQSIYNYSSVLNSSALGPTKNTILFQNSLSQNSEQEFRLSYEASTLFNDKYYYRNLNYSGLSAQFLKKIKRPHWNVNYKSLTIYPSVVLGIGAFQHSKASFQKADTLVENVLFGVSPQAGVEVSVLHDIYWMLRSSFSLNYSYFVDSIYQGGHVWNWDIAVYRTLNRNFYLGFRSELENKVFSYKNNPYLDISGQISSQSYWVGISVGYLL